MSDVVAASAPSIPGCIVAASISSGLADMAYAGPPLFDGASTAESVSSTCGEVDVTAHPEPADLTAVEAKLAHVLVESAVDAAEPAVVSDASVCESPSKSRRKQELVVRQAARTDVPLVIASPPSVAAGDPPAAATGERRRKQSAPRRNARASRTLRYVSPHHHASAQSSVISISYPPPLHVKRLKRDRSVVESPTDVSAVKRGCAQVNGAVQQSLPNLQPLDQLQQKEEELSSSEPVSEPVTAEHGRQLQELPTAKECDVEPAADMVAAPSSSFTDTTPIGSGTPAAVSDVTVDDVIQCDTPLVGDGTIRVSRRGGGVRKRGRRRPGMARRRSAAANRRTNSVLRSAQRSAPSKRARRRAGDLRIDMNQQYIPSSEKHLTTRSRSNNYNRVESPPASSAAADMVQQLVAAEPASAYPQSTDTVQDIRSEAVHTDSIHAETSPVATDTTPDAALDATPTEASPGSVDATPADARQNSARPVYFVRDSSAIVSTGAVAMVSPTKLDTAEPDAVDDWEAKRRCWNDDGSKKSWQRCGPDAASSRSPARARTPRGRGTRGARGARGRGTRVAARAAVVVAPPADTGPRVRVLTAADPCQCRVLQGASSTAAAGSCAARQPASCSLDQQLPGQPRVAANSAFSRQYDALRPDPSWRCVFCTRRSHQTALGDLLGPCFIRRPLEAPPVTPPVKRKRGRGASVNSTHSPRVDEPAATCSSTGVEYKLSWVGERVETWFHQSCLAWSDRVTLVSNRIHGIEQAVLDSSTEMCSACGVAGATVGCFGRGCRAGYHVPCILEAGGRLDELTLRCYCPLHVPSDETAAAKLSIIASNQL